MQVLVCVLFFGTATLALPISQPVYPTSQYIAAQQAPLQYNIGRQPQIQYAQPQYITGQPQQIAALYGSGRPRTPPPPPPPPQHPPLGITQLLLPSAADRQVQKAAASIAGPEYAQQVQNAQLQGLANQAEAVAQRRAQVTAFRLANLAQANRQAAQQPAPQYLQDLGQTQISTAGSIHQDSRGLAQNPQAPPEDYDPSPSYQFGFDVKDDYYTNYQNRKEQRDGDKISGSYSVVDSDGFIRTVTYTADPKEGFKAEVNRQPTDIVVKIPKPVQAPSRQHQYIEEAPRTRGHQQQQPQQEHQLQQPKYVYQYQ